MNSLWQDIRVKLTQSGSRINVLIGINVLVFLLINIPHVFLHMMGNDMVGYYANEYLALPASLSKLATRFWTPISYMFMHDGIFHILFNMLWLYWMGQIFEEYLGNKRIVSLYVMGGLVGALFFVLFYNVFPAFAGSLPTAVVVGASASVTAIVIATATLLPDYTIYMMFIGPVKLKWLALFFVVVDYLGIAGSNPGGMIAHLGGALMGFIYIKQLNRGNDLSRSVDQIFTQRPKVKVASSNKTTYQQQTSLIPHQEEIDRILDKISASGYESLNKHEKDVLSRASKNEG
ncbi:rhomboid family intramembrane serine protease [Mucilaginibacter terrae]|uniref:Membrane associated rhomboid family serine protease n=1 Tax=Mucilaginibacter terrae TaxID=1955052 RepID=A0ABU3GU27_9SPHI|nr:rhomboid family intramembrane serine protease [Mucilaginibacter terrae]MDT3403288.1 membrane associated rhomboid family serine protease [Mucilaginibacter terrae]